MRISDWSSDVCSSDLLRSPSIREPRRRRRCERPSGPALIPERSYACRFLSPSRPQNCGLRDVLTLPDRARGLAGDLRGSVKSEEHTSELQSLMRISYAVFCLNKKKINKQTITPPTK